MGSVQTNSPETPYPVFTTAKVARRSRAQFEATLSLIERAADLIAVVAAASLSYFIYRALGVGKGIHYSSGAVPQLSFVSEAPTEYVDIDGVLIASLGQPARKRVYEGLKRIFDVCASLGLLVLTAPFCALISVLIRRDSTGPVLFRQSRIGHNGKPFELYKFRSMRVDAPRYGLHPTGTDDPRVTRVGSWLRHTSLDELPQLINVLRGEMSLVGPRPEMPFIVEGYNARHRQRLSVVPGITGLWQLSADRNLLIHENIQYDLYYIRNRNFFMDLAILLHTAVFAMKGM